MLWQENLPNIGFEHIESNKKSYPYLYPIRDLAD
jgi:hypothetical protein